MGTGAKAALPHSIHIEGVTDACVHKFRNKSQQPVLIKWVDFEGIETQYHELLPGQASPQREPTGRSATPVLLTLARGLFLQHFLMESGTAMGKHVCIMCVACRHVHNAPVASLLGA